MVIAEAMLGCMSFVVEDFRDLLLLLREHPDWKAELRREIDDYIEKTGREAPPAVPDAAETVAPRFPVPPILRLDLAEAGITTVLWSTGFTGDFSWLAVPGALDDEGNPAQEKGISVPGVYFAGLDTQESLMAGTVLAVGQETARIVSHIAANRLSPA